VSFPYWLSILPEKRLLVGASGFDRNLRKVNVFRRADLFGCFVFPISPLNAEDKQFSPDAALHQAPKNKNPIAGRSRFLIWRNRHGKTGAQKRPAIGSSFRDYCRQAVFINESLNGL